MRSVSRRCWDGDTVVRRNIIDVMRRNIIRCSKLSVRRLMSYRFASGLERVQVW
jgi:hypothetical protein